MKDIKIVFMGTPIFAKEILASLIEEKYNVVGVVSQPDRKVGRKKEVKYTPVKEVAVENNIPVYQPENIKNDYKFLEEIKPDIIITAAYGQIVPEEVLNLPTIECINVHGSLLPKYRGGAPIHYAIINGDKKTGVTIMKMVKEMDAGDIISQKEFEIKLGDTLETVHDNMIVVAKDLLKETLPNIINDNYTSLKQDENKVVFSPTIKREEEAIDWSKQGIDIYNQIRGMNPWPVAYSQINGKKFKFFTTKFIEDENKKESGLIIDITKDSIEVEVIGGTLKLIDFQIEGKKKVTISDFINGNNFLKIGDRFE